MNTTKLNKEALAIASSVQKLSSTGRMAYTSAIANDYGCHVTSLAPSASTYRARALKHLVENSLLAKRTQGKAVYYSLLKSMEDIEAFFSYKSKRKYVSVKESKVKVIKPSFSTAIQHVVKEATIDLGGVKVTITLEPKNN